MEKLAHSFGLRRSTRSFAKLSSNPSPQPQQQPLGNIRSSGNKENVCRNSMGPPLVPAAGPGKSHLPATECDPNGSKRAMLSTSITSTDKTASSQTASSTKKVNASWDRRLSVGIKRTISKLKLNSKSNKSNYLPVMDFPDNDQPSPTASSVSSVPSAGGQSCRKGSSSSTNTTYDTGHAVYRSGIGASLDQLNTLGSGSNSSRYYENQAANFHGMEAQQRRQISAVSSNAAGPPSTSTSSSNVVGAPSASPFVARAPRMGTSALRYSRDTTSSSSRPSRLDQSFNAMLPVAEEQQDVPDSSAENGFLWKAGWLSRYNLRSSQSRLSMSYADDPIVAGGGVDDSYMAEDLDDTRTGDAFNASLMGMAGSACK